MKFVIGSLTGFVVGFALFLLAITSVSLFDPDTTPPAMGSEALSLPIAGSGSVVVMQSATDYPWIADKPADATPPNVHGMRSAISVMLSSQPDSRSIAYIARISSLAGDSRPLLGEFYEENLWHVVMPERGSFVVYSRDNLWGFARQMALSLVSGNDWTGRLRYATTDGPAGTAASVIGVNGEFAGFAGHAELDQTVRRVTAKSGDTDIEATLVVEFNPER